MDVLQLELAKLHKDGNLNQSIQDVDKIIEQLERARESIVAGMQTHSPQIWKSGGSWTSAARGNLLDWGEFCGQHSLTPYFRPKLCSLYSREDTKSYEERLRQGQRGSEESTQRSK
jgi:hypothetical protein